MYWIHVICALMVPFGCLAQNTFDLTSVEPDAIPSGVTLEWHTAIPAGSGNVYATPAAAAPGLYYAVFNYGNDCYSTPSPIRIGKTSCPVPTADLTQYADPATVPAGSEITYHTGSPATDANVYAGNPTTAVPGKYYLAYHDQTNLCYSGTRPVVVLSYENDPAPVAVIDSSVNNVLEQTVSLGIVGNDTLSTGALAGISDVNVTLTIDGLPTGSVVNPDGSVTVPGQGTWSYDAATGEITFDPLSNFKDNPRRLTYLLTDNSTCKTSQATVKITYQGAMPVTLVSFEGKLVEKSVELLWVTAVEYNVSHFEIQRSTNAKDFVALANVAANNVKSSYRFTDARPLPGTNYYRLKMIDLDSTFAYSKIVNAKLSDAVPLVVYPNPASDVLQINPAAISKPTSVKLYDQAGRLRRSVALAGKNQVDVGSLPDGLYIVNIVSADGTTYNTRVVLKK